MKTAVFQGPGQPLAIRNAPEPVPGPHDVVVKVARCGICATDLAMSQPGPGPMFAVGTAIGHEYAGEIVAFGSHAQSGLAVGDRVAVLPMSGCGACAACAAGEPLFCAGMRLMWGGFSEYTLADSRFLVKLPAALSFIDGALVEPLACGRRALRLSGVQPGGRMLVIGAGAIAMGVVFWARRLGWERVAVTARSTRRAALARSLGASDFLTQGPDLRREAEEALKGQPDIVVECAGQPGLLGQAIDCVAPHGTIVSTGLCYHPETIVAAAATYKELRLQFSIAYSLGDFRHCVDVLEEGHLEPRAMVENTIGLDALPSVLEALRHENPHCKTHVAPWASR